MAGVGFSVGDIIAAGKLAKDIYENCFTKEQGADVRYAQFRQDIKSLGDSLGQLESIINNANNQLSHPHRFGIALQVLPDVTGDFHQTLNDCEKLLRKHAGLQRGRSNFLENFTWWTSAERDVNSLRERVKFHVTKVAFIAKPFETQLLLGIQRDVQQLRRDVAHLTGVVINGVGQTRNASNPPFLDSVAFPDHILDRFTIAFNLNRPVCFEKRSDWPLKEGFDALVFHFSKSTIEFNSRPELGQNIPEGPQYLNLLKCIWIMERLKSSSYLTNAGTDSLWADYMRGLEDEIRAQFRRFESGQLIAPTQDVISILPDSFYSIWVVEAPQLRLLNMAEQRPLEEKILELFLPQLYGTGQSSLTVFRKSDTQFRLVTTTKRADNPMFREAEGFHVDMTSTRLIPSYATPNKKFSATNNIALCNDKGQSPEWISLSSSTDIARLQQALMGYRVQHDMSNLSWCVNGSKEEGDWGYGRLQLWQSKPLTEILPDREIQSTEDRNVSVSTHRLPQPEFGSNMFSPEMAQLGSDLMINGQPPDLHAERTTPIVFNTTSGSDGVAEPSHSSLYQISLSADSITAAPPHASDSSRSTYAQSPLSSPSLSRSRRVLSGPTSIGNTCSYDLKPDLKKHSTGRSSTTRVTRSSIVSPVNGPHGNGVELFRPEVPVLVIFTICRGKYTFLHVKLDPNIFINSQSCDCRNPRKACTRVILESNTKKKPFTVHRYSAKQEHEKGIYSWDLALFRSPRRQELKDLGVIEKMKTLEVAFATVTAKDEFIKELTELENVRTVEQNEYRKNFQQMRRRALV